ncbi:MAG: hypothetical protein K5673_03305 [Lachnospiraceae bacterium]|nr:hypothetical protein [Lachnospiraceae bacterium]
MIKKHLAKAGIIMIVGMLSAIGGLVSYELFKDNMNDDRKLVKEKKQ